jgi:hypothetical protein
LFDVNTLQSFAASDLLKNLNLLSPSDLKSSQKVENLKAAQNQTMDDKPFSISLLLKTEDEKCLPESKNSAHDDSKLGIKNCKRFL